MRKIIDPRYLMVLLFAIFSLSASADCGSTDYSGSMGRLYDMVVYVLNMCVFTMRLMYAVASVLAIYSATSIYIKLQAGEEGFTKSVLVLVGSCLFLVGATVVMPAFFGFSYGNTSSLKFW